MILEVFREDIPRAQLLHNTRISKRLWYAVYIILHIGYLCYNIKAGCKDERSKVFYTSQLKVHSCACPSLPHP